MDFFFLAGLVLLAFPIIAIVALVKTININERLRAIEARFAALELQRTGAPGAAPVPSAAPQPAPEPVTPAATKPPAVAKARPYRTKQKERAGRLGA